jgi:YD repeat-containing protein
MQWSICNRIFMVDSDGGRTTHSYDLQDRLTLILNPYGERRTIVWDNLGREWKKTLGNGTVVSQVYDAAGRVVLQSNVNHAGAGLAVYTGTYDAVGNRSGVLELDGTWGNKQVSGSRRVIRAELLRLSWEKQISEGVVVRAHFRPRRQAG